MNMRSSFAVAVAAALIVMFLAIAVPPAKADTMQIYQTFDTALSTSNAGWSGLRNTGMPDGPNFGWNSGNTVSGTGGQAGGTFTRYATGSTAYFADTTIGSSGTTSGTLNASLETLTMSGVLRFNNNNFGTNNGDIRLGWFNTGTFTTSVNTDPFIGLLLRGENSGSMRIWGAVSDPTLSITGSVTYVADNQTYDFWLRWTPSTLGRGTLSGTIAGSPFSQTLTGTTAASQRVFNAFGIVNGYGGGNTPATNTTGYFDNLTYTVVPEPSLWAVAGVAAGCAVSWREVRRRRRRSAATRV